MFSRSYPTRRARPRSDQRNSGFGSGWAIVAWRAPIGRHQFSIMPKRVGDVALMVGLAALYVVVARVGLSLDAVAGFATVVWPPSGLALAAVLLIGSRAWPGILIGAISANLLTGASIAVALGIGLGNTAEAVACAYLIR